MNKFSFVASWFFEHVLGVICWNFVSWIFGIFPWVRLWNFTSWYVWKFSMSEILKLGHYIFGRCSLQSLKCCFLNFSKLPSVRRSDFTSWYIWTLCMSNMLTCCFLIFSKNMSKILKSYFLKCLNKSLSHVLNKYYALILVKKIHERDVEILSPDIFDFFRRVIFWIFVSWYCWKNSIRIMLFFFLIVLQTFRE